MGKNNRKKSYFKCPACNNHWIRRKILFCETCIQCNALIFAYKTRDNSEGAVTEAAVLKQLKILATEVANVALSECH